MSSEDRVAVITGAGNGIGRATALQFAAANTRVVVAERDEAAGKETVSLVRAAGGDAEFVSTDVTDFAQVAAAVDFAVAQFGRIDVMVNNAGISRNRPLLSHEPADFDAVVQVNQYGVYYGILAAARKMLALRIKGTIINLSSVYAVLASPGMIGYCAAKGAVRMMTRTAALELAPFGIRVVELAPGVVQTSLLDEYREAKLERHIARGHMRGRLLEPEQMARIAVFLASEEAGAINGSTVMADDGFTSFK